MRLSVVGACVLALVAACGTRTQLPGGDVEDPFGPPDPSPIPGDDAPVIDDRGGLPGVGGGGAAGVASGGGAASDYDFASIADPAMRRRYERCAGYCEVIVQPQCGGRSIADGFEQCLDSCADRDGRCAPAVLGAFECIAADPERTILCNADGDPVIACGPCDDELSLVARRCENDDIRCQFR